GVGTVYVHAGETVTLTGIPAGTEYTVTEADIEGFEHQADLDVNVTGTITDGETIAVSVTNKPVDPVYGKFTLKKTVVNAETTDKFDFQIILEGLVPNKEYTFNGKVYVANSEGNLTIDDVSLGDGETAVFDNLPIGSTYTVIELASGYKASYEITDSEGLDLIVKPSDKNTVINKDLSTQTETVDEDEDILITFTNKPEVHRVYFAKYDDKGEFLPGAEFEILGANGTVVATFTSLEDDMVWVELAAGTYTVHETKVPEGYLPVDDITFTIDSDGNILIDDEKVNFVEIINEPINVQINKIDEDDNPVSGASMAIYLAAGEQGTEYTGEPIYSFITTDSPKTITGKLQPDTRYVLVELNAPDGYETADPVAFVTGNTSETILVTMTDVMKNFEVPVIKVDEDGQPVAGALLQIFDAEGTKVTEWTTTTEQKVLELKPGTYTLHEETAPTGYDKAEDIEFTVDVEGHINGDASIVTITMTDTLHEYSIPVIKVDEDGEPVAGAKLQIFDAEGTKVAEWVTTTEPKEVNLTAGSYTLHEDTAPTGYDKAEDIEFTVDMEGHINGDADIVTITMTDTLHRNEINILKVDVDGNPVEGADLQLLDADGEVIEEWTSTNEAKVVSLPAGNYTLHEDHAPEGYKDADDVGFTVGMDGLLTSGGQTVELIKMTDVLRDYRVGFLKVDEDDNPINNVPLEVYAVGGSLIESFDSDTEPVYLTLNPGDYYLHEAEAPTGYDEADDVYFTVKMDSDVIVDGVTVVTVKMVDTLHEYSIPVIKVNEDEEPVAGALLQVFDSEGTKVAEWTTTTEQKVLQLTAGTYTLHEETAPTGYDKAEDIEFTVDMEGHINGDADIVTITMTDTLHEYSIPVIKVDEDGEPVEGAKLQIFDAEGTKMAEWVTTTEPKEVNLTAGSYTL
ncbi:MAG: hypothetical protein J5694_07165, partial [Erysipelotrichaceae bacterium]|nr:hypothetical protein [Erysipelotrichaceae bacterium]